MIIKVHKVNAFAINSQGGNPAGVVLNADKLSDQQMLEVAQKVGFSETAFIQQSKKADFKVRFFTPNGEVDLCGHATIASFSFMAEKNLLLAGCYIQETKAGLLPVEIKSDGLVYMDQTLPQFFEEVDRQEIAISLNISVDVLDSDLPIQIVSTGLKDILIPVKKRDELNSIHPNFEKVAEVSKKYNVVGYHLFSMETECNAIAHCRNLAPLYDIPEESATGTSNGALSCYLFRYNRIDAQQVGELVFEQGYSMGKSSEINVSLALDKQKIVAVKVGGKAFRGEVIELEV